jgi:hypothetical protein
VWDGEELVIQKTVEHGERPHSEKHVSSITQSFRNFVLDAIMEDGETESKEEDKGSMAVIAEHDSEHEGEGTDCEWSWVGFLIVRNTIRVNNLLEDSSHFILFEISRGVKCMRCVIVLFVNVELGSMEFLDLSKNVSL